MSITRLQHPTLCSIYTFAFMKRAYRLAFRSLTRRISQSDMALEEFAVSGLRAVNGYHVFSPHFPVALTRERTK